MGFWGGAIEKGGGDRYAEAVCKVKRLLVSDRIFFVTVNLRRDMAFLDRAEFPLVIDALEESRRREKFLLCGYVLMPDHWHALIWVGYPLTISRAVQSVKGQAARRINARRGTTGTVWQHQFWDRLVRHGKEFSDRLMYMHLNPVRRGLVKGPEDWPWSSYNNFALEKQPVAACPIQIDYVRMPG